MKKKIKRYTTFALAFLMLFRFSVSVPGYQAAKDACYNAGKNAVKNVKIDIDWSKFNFN